MTLPWCSASGTGNGVPSVDRLMHEYDVGSHRDPRLGHTRRDCSAGVRRGAVGGGPPAGRVRRRAPSRGYSPAAEDADARGCLGGSRFGSAGDRVLLGRALRHAPAGRVSARSVSNSRRSTTTCSERPTGWAPGCRPCALIRPRNARSTPQTVRPPPARPIPPCAICRWGAASSSSPLTASSSAASPAVGTRMTDGASPRSCSPVRRRSGPMAAGSAAGTDGHGSCEGDARDDPRRSADRGRSRSLGCAVASPDLCRVRRGRAPARPGPHHLDLRNAHDRCEICKCRRRL